MSIIHLHVDSRGLVWSDDEDETENSGLRAVAYLARWREELAGADAVRLVGSSGNAELAARLADCGLGGLCRLGSPLLLRDVPEAPEAVLAYLRHLPARYGHARAPWCPLTTAMAAGYRLAATAGAGYSDSTEAVRTLHAHPAWPALSFVPSLDSVATVRLLAQILDPRWFRHPSRPDRWNRLYRFLGLTRANAGSFLNRTGACRSWAFSAWYRGGGPVSWERSFLWKQWQRRQPEADPAGALLAGTRCFVRFLITDWLASLSPQPGLSAADFLVESGDRELFLVHRRRVLAVSGNAL